VVTTYRKIFLDHVLCLGFSRYSMTFLCIEVVLSMGNRVKEFPVYKMRSSLLRFWFASGYIYSKSSSLVIHERISENIKYSLKINIYILA
jgi:hypothetical protein